MEPARGARAREKAGDAAIAAAEILRDVVVERFTRPKYDDAVDLVMGVLDKRIGVVDAKTKPGAKPSQSDSQTIDLLKDIRSEMETAFEERWNNRERPVAD